ncbi:MAG: FecR domain-containing protein [Chthoniobacteraceae bacterium]
MPSPLRILLASLCVSAAAFAEKGVPYSQATVTRLQNKVSYGRAAEGAHRPAQSGDVVKAQSYLLTETDARAELKYDDGSIVRIGQNTVFTFEASTRTLTLAHGSLIFYIPKGVGGGTLRTASMTASITGTIGKVADNLIAILEGEVTLVPSGQKVGAGYFARRNADGTITVARFDPATALGGKLWEFGGPIAEFDESSLLTSPPASTIVRDIMHDLEMTDRMQNFPGAQELFNPKKETKPKEEKKPDAPTPTPIPVRATPTPRPSAL